MPISVYVVVEGRCKKKRGVMNFNRFYPLCRPRSLPFDAIIVFVVRFVFYISLRFILLPKPQVLCFLA